MAGFRHFYALGLIVIPITASANITLQTGNNPLTNSQNILFNGSGAISGPALLVSGMTSVTGDLVDFDGAGKNLVTPSSGQARVEAETGTFATLNIYADSGSVSFVGMVFNLDAENDGNLSVTVHANDGDHVFSTNAISSSGQNFFTVGADGGNTFTGVSLSGTSAYDDVKQVRVDTGAVPEPATLGMLGLGLVGFARRRKA